MDEIFWKPGWIQSESDEFQAALVARMRDAEKNAGGWVAEGDYLRKGGGILHDASTDTIWLDPPLLLYFPRLILRTFRRLFGVEPTCSPGCPESVREVFFSKESIIWWCISQHWRSRSRNWTRMREIGIGVGHHVERRRLRRFGGWGGELASWLDDVRALAKYRQN